MFYDLIWAMATRAIHLSELIICQNSSNCKDLCILLYVTFTSINF